MEFSSTRRTTSTKTMGRRSGSEKHAEELHRSMSMLSESNGLWTAWCDFTNARLHPDGVCEACKTEMKFFKGMKAYTSCPTACVDQEIVKLVDVKWIDMTNGDALNLVHVSRLSPQPLEAIRLKVSDASMADYDDDNGERRDVMINDTRLASFAPSARALFVRRPQEA